MSSSGARLPPGARRAASFGVARALYSRHLTQKNKKWKDGVVHVFESGKVVLYDGDYADTAHLHTVAASLGGGSAELARREVVTAFLRRSEVVCGEPLTLERVLVELDEDVRPPELGTDADGDAAGDAGSDQAASEAQGRGQARPRPPKRAP